MRIFRTKSFRPIFYLTAMLVCAGILSGSRYSACRAAAERQTAAATGAEQEIFSSADARIALRTILGLSALTEQLTQKADRDRDGSLTAYEECINMHV